MVTNYPQQLAASAEHVQDAPIQHAGLMSRMVSRLNQALCGLSGHDPVLHFEGRRVMMRCTSCGHDTPGWEVADKGPRLRYEGDARRHALKPEPRLVYRRSA